MLLIGSVWLVHYITQDYWVATSPSRLNPHISIVKQESTPQTCPQASLIEALPSLVCFFLFGFYLCLFFKAGFLCLLLAVLEL